MEPTTIMAQTCSCSPRLLSKSMDARQRLGPLFAKRVAEQLGSPGDALAMRMDAAAVVDVCNTQDYQRLAGMQEARGFWPVGWVYRYGITGIRCRPCGATGSSSSTSTLLTSLSLFLT